MQVAVDAGGRHQGYETPSPCGYVLARSPQGRMCEVAGDTHGNNNFDGNLLLEYVTWRSLVTLVQPSVLRCCIHRLCFPLKLRGVSRAVCVVLVSSDLCSRGGLASDLAEVGPRTCLAEPCR